MNRRQNEEDEQETDTIVLVKHLVLVKRDPMQVIPVHVFEHELPILHKIHGSDNIKPESQEEVEVTNFNAGDEYDRLVEKYEKSAPGAVQEVYGRDPKDLADTLGLAFRRVAGVRAARTKPQSVQVDNTQPEAVKSEVRARIVTETPVMTTPTPGVKTPTAAELRKATGSPKAKKAKAAKSQKSSKRAA